MAVVVTAFAIISSAICHSIAPPMHENNAERTPESLALIQEPRYEITFVQEMKLTSAM
jgi:hypothetical protein